MVSHKKHYLLFYFAEPCFTFFRMHFCVNKHGGHIMDGVTGYDENSSKIRTNIPNLFPREEMLGTRLQLSILGTRKQGWVILGLHERLVMHQLFAWIDTVSENNCLLILFIPSRSHKEIVKQILQNLIHSKSCNITNFRCVLLKLEKHQDILPSL